MALFSSAELELPRDGGHQAAQEKDRSAPGDPGSAVVVMFRGGRGRGRGGRDLSVSYNGTGLRRV